MEIALYVLLGLAVFFVFFYLLPSVMTFLIVVGRRKTRPVGDMKKPTP